MLRTACLRCDMQCFPYRSHKMHSSSQARNIRSQFGSITFHPACLKQVIQVEMNPTTVIPNLKSIDDADTYSYQNSDSCNCTEPNFCPFMWDRNGFFRAKEEHFVLLA